MESYQLRVMVEANELAEKIDKLDKFLQSPANLTDTNHLLCQQLAVMRQYFDILMQRISLFDRKNQKKMLYRIERVDDNGNVLTGYQQVFEADSEAEALALYGQFYIDEEFKFEVTGVTARI